MTVHQLQQAPSPTLAQALERFEQQFTYPLGPGRSFRISHGADYPRFFRAMGDAACFVAERDGQVVGVLGAAIREVLQPTGDFVSSVYLGDLKVDPTKRGGRVLPSLANAATQWATSRVHKAYSVVMDGTPVVPTRYTGRLGIPQFQELGKIAVLRLSAGKNAEPLDPGWQASDTVGAACYHRLSAGRHACHGGFPAERSEIAPIWLMDPSSAACGRLEDTRRAKRLITDDGGEMISAHLSCFAYATIAGGAELARVALQRAADLGFPALFVAIARADADAFCKARAEIEIVDAPATIYGAGFEPGFLWNINTAEI